DRKWDKAFQLAEQLARDNPQSSDFQVDLARLALRRAEATDAVKDYEAARHRLIAVESQLPRGTQIEVVRKALITKAERLQAEGIGLAEKDKAAAVEKLKQASLVWPHLPELQEKLRELDRDHPVLVVGVHSLPVYLSPATACTDTEKQA